MNIHVGNLSAQVTENQLNDLFTPYGAVQSVKVVTDSFTGKSKGFAYVEMSELSEARLAITELHHFRLDEKMITVGEAKPRKYNNNLSGNRY